MFTNIFCAVIGIVLALALAAEYRWGPWGLLVSLLTFSSAGWILADPRGFTRSLKRACQKVLREEIPACLGAIIKSLVSYWHELKRSHTETGSGYLFLLLAPYILGLIVLFVWVCVQMGCSFKLEELPLLISIPTLLTCLSIIGVMLYCDIKRRTETEKLAPHTDDLTDARFKEVFPKFWDQAQERTRAHAWRALQYGNPIVFPFVLARWLIQASIWLLTHLPIGIWRLSAWICRFNWRVSKLTYLYANSDLRRIAFSSIALGMVLGFAVGYYLGQPLLGTMLGGATTGTIGWLQHRLIYPHLVREPS